MTTVKMAERLLELSAVPARRGGSEQELCRQGVWL